MANPQFLNQLLNKLTVADTIHQSSSQLFSFPIIISQINLNVTPSMDIWVLTISQ